MLKIVIDTNLLIDGSTDSYNFGNRIIDLVISGNVKTYANRATLRENKLLAQEKINDEGYLKKLEYFYNAVNLVDSINRISVVEDHEDNKILESAIAASADYLITSDHHLLKLESFKGVKIIRPDSFWQIWEEEGESGWTKWLDMFIN